MADNHQSISTTLPWRASAPFILMWEIDASDIDHYDHVNNTAYIRQMEVLAWAHSAGLGITIDDYRSLDRAMVIKHHRIDYIRPCYAQDTLATGTWITFCDNKLRLTREFQFFSLTTNQLVMQAQTDYVCTTLSQGKPVRMPSLFIHCYGDNVQSGALK